MWGLEILLNQYLPPIGRSTVYDMYGSSESEHMLVPGELLPLAVGSDDLDVSANFIIFYIFKCSSVL